MNERTMVGTIRSSCFAHARTKDKRSVTWCSRYLLALISIGCAASACSSEAAPTSSGQPAGNAPASPSPPAQGSGGASGGLAGAGGASGSTAEPPLSQSGGGGAAASSHSRSILLDTSSTGANVAENVANYPLAILLDATNFDFTQARADGQDVWFQTPDGKKLPHAIELWDPIKSSAALWVKMDMVLGNTPAQAIRMHWGGPSAAPPPNSAAVFSRASGFVGAWHLDQEGNTAPGGYQDASENGAHGTGVGMVVGSRVDGRVGKAVHLDNPIGQDVARWIRVDGDKGSAFNPGPALTVSIWALGYSYPIVSYETIFSKGDTSWSLQRVQYDRNGYQSCLVAGGGHMCAYNFDAQPLVTGEWLHFMVVLEQPTMRLYINGKLNSSSTGSNWAQGDHPLAIGNQTERLDGRRQWDGILDEARVMDAARSESWAKLDYESQRQNPTLVSFGPVQP